MLKSSMVLIFAFSIFGAIANELLPPNSGQVILTELGQIVIACISGYCLVKVAQLKTHINSRMDELLKLTGDMARAEGVIEGVKNEKADAALIAKGAEKASSEPPAAP